MATLIDITTTVTEAPQWKFCFKKADHIAEVSLLMSFPISSYDIQKQDSTTIVVKHRQTLKERIKVTACWVRICTLTNNSNSLQNKSSMCGMNCWMTSGRVFCMWPLVLPVSVFYSLSHLSLPGEYHKNETSFQKFEAKLAKMEDRILDLNTRLRIVEGADFEITSISNCSWHFTFCGASIWEGRAFGLGNENSTYSRSVPSHLNSVSDMVTDFSYHKV